MGIYVIRCKFTGNTGGHVFLRASNIANSYFENNKECYIQGKNLVDKNSKFINDKGYVAASKIDKCGFSKNDLKIEANSMSNSKFTKNVISDYIDAKTVKNCHFIQNNCICGAMMSSQTVVNSKFIKNVCKGDLLGAGKLVSNCRFEKNNYGTYYDGSNIVNCPKLLNKCLFESNNGKKGSIISDVNTINGCTFKNNKVTDYGMGMVYYVKQVLNSKFINNKALRSVGGAIDDVSIVKNCIFKNNYALAGGAISTIGKFAIERCIFEKNEVKHSASAIYLSAIPKPLTGVIKNCKFIKNKANGKLNPYNYPFKNYNKGTIFAFGDYKMKITIKNCKGL